MNKKEGNTNRNSSRPNSSRPNSNKPKPAMAKRAQGPKKVKPTTEATTDKKNASSAQRAPRTPKTVFNNVAKPLKTDEIRLNKYISNSGACSRRDADIYIQSGNVKVNNIVITEMGYKVKCFCFQDKYCRYGL